MNIILEKKSDAITKCVITHFIQNYEKNYEFVDKVRIKQKYT